MFLKLLNQSSPLELKQNYMESRLRGTGTAIVTPFKSSGEIDYDATRRILDHQLDGGVEMIVPLGTTGENPTISFEERLQFVRMVTEYVNRRALVIVGTGTNDTRSSIEYTRAAMLAGADGALVVTPYYNKPTPSGLFEHFKAVADVGLPVVMYNVPSRTGVNMLPETALRCAELPNVVGTKEASLNIVQCMEIIRNAPPDFCLLSGEDTFTLPLIALGAQGSITVVSNEMPGEYSRMVRFALAGQYEEAKALHYELLDLMNVNFVETNPGPVKAALAMMGLIEENYRLPMIRMSEESRKQVRTVLEQLGGVVLEELEHSGS